MMGWFESDEDARAWRMASLRLVSSKLIFVNATWPRQEQVDRATQMLGQARLWCSGLADSRMRKECLSWCDFAERAIGKAAHELKTKERQMELAAFRRDMEATDRRVAEILESHQGSKQ